MSEDEIKRLQAKADQSTVIAAELRARAKREEKRAELYLAEIIEIEGEVK